MNSQLHIKDCPDKENCRHSLKVLDCVTNIEKSLNREIILNGSNFLTGLFRVTPGIWPKISKAENRSGPSNSYHSIQRSESRVNLCSQIQPESYCSNSQESLQLASMEVSCMMQ
ncbi:unnamed protein product [Schistosoma turkestanicum]|nr:unnamed protein product [Schistosoma turkestanicum]